MDGNRRAGLLLAAILGAAPAPAEVTSAAPGGFTVRHEVSVDAPATSAWRLLVAHTGEWWNSDHTYSGDARNLYLEARPNGCFCERLGEDGAVVHMTVTFVDPGRMLRLTGGLGPLGLMGVNGNMTFSFSEDGDGLRIALDYAVGGYSPEGLDGIAGAVDQVLVEQLERLKNLIETGDPAPPA